MTPSLAIEETPRALHWDFNVYGNNIFLELYIQEHFWVCVTVAFVHSHDTQEEIRTSHYLRQLLIMKLLLHFTMHHKQSFYWRRERGGG